MSGFSLPASRSRSAGWPGFVVLAFAALLAVAVAGLVAPHAPAAAKGKPAKARVTVLTGSQSSAATGRLRVKVSAPASGPGKARGATLKLSVKQAWSAKVQGPLVRFRISPGRSRILKVRVPSDARALIRNCGAPTITATFSARRKGDLKPFTAKTKRKLRRQNSRCAVPADVDLSRAASCDFIAAAGNACLAPFPNDFYTKRDPDSATGLRVDVAADATPLNKDDVHIGVDSINQSDGFSPGPLLSVRIPGLETQAAFDQSGLVPLTAMDRAFDAGQPAVLIDADTGERQLIWAELDAQATTDADRNLLIRPGRNLVNGHRYIVALRNLKDAAGAPIEAPAGFRLYRDNRRTGNGTVESRRAHFESIFRTLGRSGIGRKDLYLAWDFTVASTENITGRMLSIRNRAFAELGDTNLTDGTVQGDSPQFTVTNVENFPTPTGDGVEDIRRVTGTFQVPCFLDKPNCVPGSKFNLDGDQKPVRTPGNMMTARFVCNIPRSAVQDDGGGGFEVAQKARPSLYGHGLFGAYTETRGQNIRQLGNENNMIVCGTDWSGMSENDVVQVLPALFDLTGFPILPDGLQQGFLNFLFLGRMLIHPDGLAADPAFQFGGESVLDTDDLFYYGNSQGGIAGGALTAIATDFTRSVLYVPGMNYSTLLTRSVDFDTYQQFLYPSYPDEMSRPAMFALMQMMWDRGEPNGYANNMTDNPLPGTPPHKVLIEMAYGDHQVANVATEVEARTIGAPLRSPALDLNRLPAGIEYPDPFYGHEALGDLSGPAADGNGYFVWDIGPKRVESNVDYGTDPPPLTDLPPDDSYGVDPHDTVIRSSPVIRKQIADFLKTNGKITDPCGNHPCYAAGWMGAP